MRKALFQIRGGYWGGWLSVSGSWPYGVLRVFRKSVEVGIIPIRLQIRQILEISPKGPFDLAVCRHWPINYLLFYGVRIRYRRKGDADDKSVVFITPRRNQILRIFRRLGFPMVQTSER